MHHHYVPQFLLGPWADSTPDGKVEVFRLDLGDLRSARRSPKHTGYEDNLYALSKPIVAGMKQQAIEEHFLKHVDNLAAGVRRKLHDEGLSALTLEDRMDWARFLMSLRIRQPAIVQILRDESSAHLRQTLASHPEQYEEMAGVDDPPTLEEWTEQRFPGLIENFGLSFFYKLVDNPSIGEKLMRMRWWIWDFSGAPHELLIADHPCIFTCGIDDPNLIIALPISPKKAFLATRSDRTAAILRRQKQTELAVKLNELSLNQARIRIYARNSLPERFIRNRLAKRSSKR